MTGTATEGGPTWRARLLAKEMLPQSWIPPAEIQQLRDRTRLRKALAEDRQERGDRFDDPLNSGRPS